MRFQRRYLVAYDEMNTYPEEIKLEYNIWEYLSFNHALVNEPTTYLLEFPEDKTMSFAKFLELFYFARRRNFGKTTVERIGIEKDTLNVARRGEASARATSSTAPGPLEA